MFVGWAKNITMIADRTDLNRDKVPPLPGAPWDQISEKICIVVYGERQIIFRSRLNCAMSYTCYQLKDNFAGQQRCSLL